MKNKDIFLTEEEILSWQLSFQEIDKAIESLKCQEEETTNTEKKEDKEKKKTK